MILEIKSVTNEKYKHIKSLHLKKSRMKNGEFTVEGIKSVRDAILSGMSISSIVVSDEFYETKSFDYKDINVYKISDNIFSGLCDTESPQGIIAVIKIEKNPLACDTNKLYIYCDNVTDPGNIGTIIRTADAAGFGGVLLSSGCVDIYNPKTVRSSMGSFFHISLFENIDIDDLKTLKGQGFQLLSGAISDNSIEYTACDMTIPTIIIVGNESNGVSDDVLLLSDECIQIPIIGMAESLNVSVAGSILMYEALRQRRTKHI